MKTILIYGANSSIGKAFRKQYPQYNYILCSRRTSCDGQDNCLLIDYQKPNLNQIDWGTVDEILYCVGITNGSPQKLAKVNIQFLDIFLKNVPENIPIHFISSIAVISNHSPYAQSKLEAEKLLHRNHQNITIYRPSVLVGHDEKNNFPIIKNIIKKSPIIPIILPSPIIYPIQLCSLNKIIFQQMNQKQREKALNLSGQKAIELNKDIESFLKSNRSFFLTVKIPIHLLQNIVSILGKIPFFPKRLLLIQQITSYKQHPPVPCDNKYYELLSKVNSVFFSNKIP